LVHPGHYFPFGPRVIHSVGKAGEGFNADLQPAAEAAVPLKK